MGFRIAATTLRPCVLDLRQLSQYMPKMPHSRGVHIWSRVQRLVAKTVYVERETALVVGGDNVLLGVNT